MARYLVRLLLFAFLALAAIGGFNGFIDPYGHFGGWRAEGVNKLPLGFNHRLRLAKALAVSRLRPATIILGNSRAEGGYDADYPGFAERPAYNLALGGAGLGEARRYLLEAAAAGRLRQVVLALDLAMFEPALRIQEESDDSVLLTDESGKAGDPGRKWRRLAFVLLSGTACDDSWWSLTHQRKPVAIYLPSGRRDESADQDQVLREGGHRAASRRMEATFLAGSLRDTASAEFRRSYAATLEQLREIAALAEERDFRLSLVINPIHARFSYMFAAAGLWPFYEQWKRDLLAIAATRPQRVALWDFSGVSPCTAETMPPLSDHAISMRWYRESAHFRPVLGERVLDRVFDRAADEACPDLGWRLEPKNVETILARQRDALARWIGENAEDAAEIAAAARSQGRAR